jgi:hypothetical protein
MSARTQADRWTARFESARATAEIAREAIDLPRNWPTIPAEAESAAVAPPPPMRLPGSLGLCAISRTLWPIKHSKCAGPALAAR